MATAAAAATGTPATEFSFFEETKRTERIKIMDIVDKSTKEIYIGNDEDVEEALEREIRCPCLGRKIETKGVVSIAYFKKDDLEKNKGRIDAGTLQLIATIISNEDKLEPDERERIKGAFNGPPLNLMRTLVEVDNALQRRAQTANYQLFQSFTDDDVKDPTFPKYQGISQAPQAPSVKCDVETGKDYPFKPVVRRSRSIEKREPDILVYMYDEDNIMDRPAVVLDKDSAAQMGLPKFVVSSLLLFSPLVFHGFRWQSFRKPSPNAPKEVSITLTEISTPMVTVCYIVVHTFSFLPSFHGLFPGWKQTSRNEDENIYRVELGRYYFVCKGKLTHPGRK